MTNHPPRTGVFDIAAGVFLGLLAFSLIPLAILLVVFGLV